MADQNQDSSTLKSKLGRRSFMKGAGLTSVGLAGAAVLGSRLGVLDNVPGAAALGMGSSRVEAAMAYGDVNILNYALQLEYLEAEFYTVAVTGKTIEESGIAVSGTGKSGPTTGGKQVDFYSDGGTKEASGRLTDIAHEIMLDEQAHVKFLHSALGSAAVAKPTIDLDALGIGFDNFQQFLVLARAFEDTGVSAYGGAAAMISSKTLLAYAAAIGLTEALHSANLRLLVAENHVQTMKLDSKDVLPPPSGTEYFETAGNAMAVVRDYSEVLMIVYHTTAHGVKNGGFFPDGMNGYFMET